MICQIPPVRHLLTLLKLENVTKPLSLKMVLDDDESIYKCVFLWSKTLIIGVPTNGAKDEGSHHGFWTSTLGRHMDSLMDKSRLNELEKEHYYVETHYYSARNTSAQQLCQKVLERSHVW